MASGSRLKIHVPILEPMVFDGDPIHYRQWSKQMECIIESAVQDNHLRLFYLEKYTTGPVYEEIKGFLEVSDETSYHKARACIEEKFGSLDLLQMAYREKLENWKKFDGNYNNVQKFSRFLETCKMLKKTVLSERMAYWDSISFIEQCILPKLPQSIDHIWRESRENVDNNMYFSTLVDCVTSLSHYNNQYYDYLAHTHELLEKHGSDHYPADYWSVPECQRVGEDFLQLW